MKKRPKQFDNPQKRQYPKSSPVTSTQNKNLIWKVTRIDDSSQWGWHKMSCPDFLRRIWGKMRHFETMKWIDILGKDHHTIPIQDIIGPAQRRLVELGHDDVERLVSFHITGKQRIWAIRSEEMAFLLWWDPNHEFCPSPKKHT